MYDWFDFLDYASYNVPAQHRDKDNSDDLKYLKTQATNIVGENLKNSQVDYYFFSQKMNHSNSDDLNDIEKELSQFILPSLILSSQKLIAS